MANPKYIEFLNTIGVDSGVKPRPLEPTDPPQDTTQLKTHIAKGLPPVATSGIDDLPFKIKIEKSEWKKIEGVGKFPKNYKPDALDFD